MKQSSIFAFLGGAVAGAAVALLLAPKSGAETRGMIKEYVDNEMKKCKCTSEHNHEHAESLAETTPKL